MHAKPIQGKGPFSQFGTTLCSKCLVNEQIILAVKVKSYRMVKGRIFKSLPMLKFWFETFRLVVNWNLKSKVNLNTGSVSNLPYI
jgi:hypothetical protein